MPHSEVQRLLDKSGSSLMELMATGYTGDVFGVMHVNRKWHRRHYKRVSVHDSPASG